MKRLSVFVVTFLLAGSLSFAQAGGGTTGAPAKGASTTDDAGKKGHKSGKKGHKGGKKSKKGQGTDTTTPPPK